MSTKSPATPPENPAHHAQRIYSHEGEDGILARIFTLLGIQQGHFVEFGAWDGMHLSNTRRLVEQGWVGILIEGDAEKFAALQRNTTAPGVQTVHAFVEVRGENSLDAILARAHCPPEFDFLSIDIDSDDLAVWLSLSHFRATCVTIEYNPTIPFDTDFINPKGRNWGNAARTITRFAKDRNYVLVAMTGLNLIFVDRDKALAAHIEAIELDLKHVKGAPRYFWGYDGTLISSASNGEATEVLRVPWHAYEFAQPMPAFLRRWHLGREWRTAERLFGGFALLVTRPRLWLRHTFKRRSRARRTG